MICRARSNTPSPAAAPTPARRADGLRLRRWLLAAMMSGLIALPDAPALAQDDFFSFLRPPANIPSAPPTRRNTNGWWPGSLFPQPNTRQPAPTAPPPEQPVKRREPPPEPEGTVYSSADAASQGRRQPPSQFALVLGDRLGAQLAQGLADSTVPERAKLAIIAQTSDDSGFLNGNVDWVSKIPGAVAAGRPNVTILVLGSEDLQPIREGSQVLEPLTERWTEAYGRRVDEVLIALRERAGRAIVVGLAPVANASLSEDYARLNEIVRARAARAGLPFVNVWDGFVDDDGKYLATGPAVDGQRRRLRTNDGIRFTRAGGRKLAFFVQKDLNRLLGDPAKPNTSVEGGPAPLNLAGGPDGARPGGRAEVSPVALTGPSRSAAQALKDGVLPPPVRGRADDFSWPPPTAPGPTIP